MQTSHGQLLEIFRQTGVLSDGQTEEVSRRLDLHAQGTASGKKGGPGALDEAVERGDPDLCDFILSLKMRSEKDHRKLITELELFQAVARSLGLAFQRIDPLKLDLDLVTRVVPRPYAIRHLIMPLSLEDDVLTLATADPFNAEVLESLAHSTGYEIKPVVAPKSDILKTINEFYGFKSSVVKAEQMVTPGTALTNLEQYVRLKSVKEMEATDKHIVNAVDFLFTYALDQRASDIHIEPKRDHARIRFRIDGVLHTIHQVPLAIHPAMASRIKMISRLDIAERRRPQDGRIKLDHKGRDFEIRVSTLPTAFGEKLVLRIFDPDIMLQDLAQIGMDADQLKQYRKLISQPYGIILVTGPTGSGKTSTLYSSLSVLSTEERNVTTIEDPIEMIHEAFNQVNVMPQIGLTFATTLRHILRQDPDIIMVGEIRDNETAQNAIQSALTGHLVLSTLHTNDAASAVTRLADMGIPHYLIGSTLLGVVAQRLARKICPHCPEVYTPTPAELASLSIRTREEGAKLKRGKGCSFCRFTGYLGRTAIFEIMPVSPAMLELISKGADYPTLFSLARKEGMRTLRDMGIAKVSRGITTIPEIYRVTMGDLV